MKPHAITIKQATELSGLGRSSLYRLFAEGKITPRKFGKRVLILVDDLERVINELPVAKMGGSNV